MVNFGSTEYLSGAVFSGSKVNFNATYSGGKVSFDGAQFTGGEVDLSSPAVYDTSPVFDSWTTPPAGLRLPDTAPQ